MNELGWLTGTDPAPMLNSLRGRASDRKLRLFGVACCRRVANPHAHPGAAPAVEVAERLADDRATQAERLQAYRGVGPGAHAGGGFTHWYAAFSLVQRQAFQAAQRASAQAAREAADDCGIGHPVVRRAESTAQAELLRCIFGNPFRPVAADPSWRTATAVAVARQMYEARDFAAMPILADALQDAGGDNADVLDHCRGPGPHVRGCWVIDLVLGKE